MSSSESKPMPGWYWPEDLAKEAKEEPSKNESHPAQEQRERSQPESEPESTSDSSATGATPRAGQGAQSSRRRTHWPPRQCRICLDTVQPTTHVPSANLPGFLQSRPHVTYEDESGRLITPCLCKGSSKYVHENCLQAWRYADPTLGRRNYYLCPTCGFKYRLARLGWGRRLASTAAQITLTIVILFSLVFILGFVADPIINLYVDPWSFLSPWSSQDSRPYDEEPVGWFEHFAKGLASMGVIGFLKILLASPFTYFRIGGGGRTRNTGRDRYEQISWIIILIGVFTFMVAVFKGVRIWSRRTLERAGERVMDVQGDDDDDDDDQ